MTDTALRPVGRQDARVTEDTLLHRNVLESMREGVLTVSAWSSGCMGSSC